MSAPEPKPIERLVRSLLVLVGIVVLGLVAGIVLVSMQNAETNRRLASLEEYVQGRGEYRDREAARIQKQNEERTRQAMCDLLDTLPEGGLLERPRAKYGCGPGIPIAELTPGEQAQLRSRPRPAVTASGEPFAGPVPRRPATSSVPVPRSPGTRPAPPTPLVDLGPVTDLICATPVPCN